MATDRSGIDPRCALLGGRPTVVRQLRAAFSAWHYAAAAWARSAGRLARPVCAALVTGFMCLHRAGATRAHTARAALARRLAAQALQSGDSASDLDRSGSLCRAITWVVVGLAAVAWLVFGWQIAALFLVLSLVPGMAAVAHWDAATDLEKQRRRFWC